MTSKNTLPSVVTPAVLVTLFLIAAATPVAAAPTVKWSKTINDVHTTHPAIVEDLEGDGDHEIILLLEAPYVVGATGNHIAVLDPQGQMRPGWPVGLGPERLKAIAVGDLNGDGTKEVVVGSLTQLYAYTSQGQPLPGFPVTPGFDIHGISLGDLDQDRRLDVLVNGIISSSAVVSAKAYNDQGTMIRTWPITAKTTGEAVSQPAVGFLNAACQPHAALISPNNGAGSSSGTIGGHLLMAEGSYAVGWPIDTGYRICETPTTLSDVDADGNAELVTVRCSAAIRSSTDDSLNDYPGIYLYRHAGQLMRFIEGRTAPHPNPSRADRLPIQQWVGQDPVTADLDGDRDLEILLPVPTTYTCPEGVAAGPCQIVYEGLVDALHHDGTPLAGWPVTLNPPGTLNTRGTNGVVVGDIDGDGDQEVLFGNTQGIPDRPKMSIVYAWHHDGRVVEGFPLTSLPGLYNGNLTITDLDQDGLVDLVRVGSTRSTTTGETPFVAAYVSVIGLSGAYQPNKMEWPLFHHDAQRTGSHPVQGCAANQAPRLNPTGDRTSAEGQPLTFTVTATDPDGDALTYSASPLPANASFDPSTQLFSWTPGFNQAGAHSLTFTVADPRGLSDTETMTVTVTNTNRAPVLATMAGQTIPEGQLLTFTVSAADPDGDPVTYDATAAGPLPDGAELDLLTGVFTWTPGFDQAGQYLVPITASDGTLSGMDSVTIMVTDTNRAPMLDPIADQIVDEDELLTVTVSAADPDGDAITSAMGSLPVGAVFDSAAGILTWTPNFEQAGSYALTASATDANGLVASISFAVTVANVNRTPTLLPIGPRTGREGEWLSFMLQASDSDGDQLTFAASMLPAGATLDAQAGTFTWTPSFEQEGNYVVTFSVTDEGGLGDMEGVPITIEHGNRPPELEPIADQTCTEGERLLMTVSATDHDGDPVTYAASHTLPGAAFDAFTRTFDWTPGYDQQGNHEVVFTVSDPNGASQAEPVLFTVTNVNRTPGFTGLGNQTVYAGQMLKITLNATDPDGDKLTYGITGLPKGALFDAAAGTFTWTPTSRQLGQYVVTFSVSDGTATVSQTITITVIKTSKGGKR